MSEETELKREYISGMSLENESIRKFKYTVLNGDLKGEIFFSESSTKRLDECRWADGKTIYFHAKKISKEYNDIKGCIESMKLSNEEV